MSAKLAKRVLASALPAHLKPAAVVMALFGDEYGERIYPSVERVAHMLSVAPRTVKRQLRQLRDMQILVRMPNTLGGGRLAGGRGRSVVYQLNVGALPPRAEYQARKGDVDVTPNSDISVTVPDPETVTSARVTVTSRVGRVTSEVINGDTSATRSTDRSSEGSSEARPTGADAPGCIHGEDKDLPKSDPDSDVLQCNECDFRGSGWMATQHFRKTRHVLQRAV